MKNNFTVKYKGFTLIELLAVIVILVIITMITVPVLLNIIDKTKKGALGSTADGLLESASIYYAKNLNDIGENKVFLFDETHDGTTTDNIKLSYKGKFNGTGSVRIYKDGKTAICIQDSKYYAIKNVGDAKVSIGTGTCSYDSETNTYLSVDLVSQELVDNLQKQLDQMNAEKQELVDALVSKGITASTTESISSLAGKVATISQGKKVISLGAGTTFDLKTNYATYGLSATDYQSLTLDNFITGVSGMGSSSYFDPTIHANGDYVYATAKFNSITCAATYNNTTGILTITSLASLSYTQVTAGWVLGTVQTNTKIPTTFAYLIY